MSEVIVEMTMERGKISMNVASSIEEAMRASSETEAVPYMTWCMTVIRM